MKAFVLEHSSTPMMEILAYGASYSELSAEVDNFCRAYFDEYVENKNQWAKQDGYRLKVDSARLACFHLKRMAQAQKDTKLEEFYATKENECINEMVEMAQTQRW